MNLEMRRMNYTGLSPEMRAKYRRVISDALADVDPLARPSLADELTQTLRMMDEVDDA